jgi:Cu+-exporting ATPase
MESEDITNSGASASSHIHIKIGDEIKGLFSVKNKYRTGIKNTISALQKAGYEMHVLSGDNSSENENLEHIFGTATTIKFTQTPTEKLSYISNLQTGQRKVLMIGDGINDSGALSQSDVGISINNVDAQFTPA